MKTPHDIDQRIKMELGFILKEMGSYHESGNSLVGTLDMGIRCVFSGEIRSGLQAMLAGWKEKKDIVSPMSHFSHVFFPSTIALTEAGFSCGTLSQTWQAAGKLLLLNGHFFPPFDPTAQKTLATYEHFYYLAVMLNSGVAINNAVKILSEEANGAWGKMMMNNLDSSLPLSNGFEHEIDPRIHRILSTTSASDVYAMIEPLVIALEELRHELKS